MNEGLEMRTRGGGRVRLTLPHRGTRGKFDLDLIAPEGHSVALYLTRKELRTLAEAFSDEADKRPEVGS